MTAVHCVNPEFCNPDKGDIGCVCVCADCVKVREQERLARLRREEQLLQLFAFEHLPSHLKVIPQPFCELAYMLVETLPRNPERTVALRKLREAKDCAVTARLWK